MRVEAVLKTDGRGLLVDPSLVRVEGDATGMTAWIEGEPARYRLVDVDLGSGLVVAIARRGLGELDARIQDPAGPGSDI